MQVNAFRRISKDNKIGRIIETGAINTTYIDRILENKKSLCISEIKIYKKKKKNTYIKK